MSALCRLADVAGVAPYFRTAPIADYKFFLEKSERFVRFVNQECVLSTYSGRIDILKPDVQRLA
jgi:hypothetical protein